jgi:UDP-N-acetylglucosamine diphosphorylase/glucosamine-1-phosphate N-acetyltransferase
MNLIIYEDYLTEQIKPFSINHAIFEIKTGLYSNLERFVNSFPKHKIYLIVRNEIEDVVRYKFPKFTVNPKVLPSAKCINSKVIWSDDYINLFTKESLLYFHNESSISIDDFNKKVRSLKYIKDDSVIKIDFIWDTIYLFNELIINDFKKIDKKPIKKYDDVKFIKSNLIHIGDNVTLKPGVIIDASNGPVFIKDNVTIDIGSLVQGPVLIDSNSYISLGAKIRSGTLIGPNCKIGGEITNSIFHGKSNKVHDGFIGHSYIGEWVNIGAGTNNSNLKNNYSNVKFDFGKKIIDSKKIFLGTMIGDFSRISISTSINTGTFIGLGSNIFNHSFNKKFVASFSWGNSEKVDFDKFIKTCNMALQRRNSQLHDSELKLLKYLYKKMI